MWLFCLGVGWLSIIVLRRTNIGTSSMTLLFYYLAPLQNDTDMTSRCMQFIFGDKGEVPYLWLKERGRERGKKSIGPWTKYGQANLISFCPNGRCSVFNLPLLFFLYLSVIQICNVYLDKLAHVQVHLRGHTRLLILLHKCPMCQNEPITVRRFSILVVAGEFQIYVTSFMNWPITNLFNSLAEWCPVQRLLLCDCHFLPVTLLLLTKLEDISIVFLEPEIQFSPDHDHF